MYNIQGSGTFNSTHVFIFQHLNHKYGQATTMSLCSLNITIIITTIVFRPLCFRMVMYIYIYYKSSTICRYGNNYMIYNTMARVSDTELINGNHSAVPQYCHPAANIILTGADECGLTWLDTQWFEHSIYKDESISTGAILVCPPMEQ